MLATGYKLWVTRCGSSGGLMDSMVPVVKFVMGAWKLLWHQILSTFTYPLHTQKGNCEVVDMSVNLIVLSFHCVYHHMSRLYTWDVSCSVTCPSVKLRRQLGAGTPTERWDKTMWSEIYVEARTWNDLGSRKDKNRLGLEWRTPSCWITYRLIFQTGSESPHFAATGGQGIRHCGKMTHKSCPCPCFSSYMPLLAHSTWSVVCVFPTCYC